MLKSQVELEELCATRGLDKLMDECKEAEAKGRASGAFYAKQIMEKYVARMAELVEKEMNTSSAGKAKAHKALVKVFDPRVIAYLSVSTVLNTMMQNTKQTTAAVLRKPLGDSLYREMIYTTFDTMNPELFYTITRELNKRHSQSARHRTTVLIHEANKKGIAFERWSLTQLNQVGEWCLSLLVAVNMIEMYNVQKSRTSVHTVVELTDEAFGLIEDTKKIISFFRPSRLPFVEKPLDWTGLTGGGYHTKRLQSTLPRCIKVSPTHMDMLVSAKDEYRDTVVRCINTLQSVEWRINKRVLAVQQAMFKGFTPHGEPEHPDFHDTDKEGWTEAQQAVHKHWKRAMSQWYTEQRDARYKAARHAYTIQVAKEFSEYPKIWFAYFADWRGRYYPATSGVSPQGTDTSKSMLEFANGKPINTPEAETFFLLLGSTKFGYDKGSIQERIQWVREHHELFLACADDPLSHTDFWFKEADTKSRYQFLAWCFEYADFTRSPGTFRSHLPCSLDGTCNGLQHYSALLRDGVGAKATNLVPADRPNDIYAQVAEVVTRMLRECEPSCLSSVLRETRPLSHYEAAYFRDGWLAHGINRKLTKRCVMTLPYGSKKFSMGRFILKDYMQVSNPTEFLAEAYKDAATFLGDFVWAAIGEVCTKAVEGMWYFQKVSRNITKQTGIEFIWWISPTRLPIVQDYWSMEYVQFRSVRPGSGNLKCMVESDRIDKLGHANGIAPNVIHSLDAAHLTMVTLAAKDAGIDSFAMIHDDYGTTAADTAVLFRLIREKFVEMYQQDPFTTIADQLESQLGKAKAPPRPEYGTLLLEQVKQSEYFFL